MEQITIVQGTAPTILFVLYQDDAVVDLSGVGVAVAFRWEQVDSTSNTYATTCTGLNASGYAYAAITTTASATAAEYVADLVVSGMSSGSWGNEEPIKIVVRDKKGA